MARSGARIRLVRREGWVGSGGISTSLAFPIEPGLLTLLNLTTGPDGGLKLIATEAEATEFYLRRFPTPHFKLRPRMPLAEFLDRYLEAGGTHHLAVSPADGLSLVGKFARLARLPLTVI
jgi:L-arabinose isomerase